MARSYPRRDFKVCWKSSKWFSRVIFHNFACESSLRFILNIVIFIAKFRKSSLYYLNDNSSFSKCQSSVSSCFSCSVSNINKHIEKAKQNACLANNLFLRVKSQSLWWMDYLKSEVKQYNSHICIHNDGIKMDLNPSWLHQIMNWKIFNASLHGPWFLQC